MKVKQGLLILTISTSIWLSKRRNITVRPCYWSWTAVLSL
jgi:hypothetical protein